jgi:hypothetical protein
VTAAQERDRAAGCAQHPEQDAHRRGRLSGSVLAQEAVHLTGVVEAAGIVMSPKGLG